VPGWKPPRSPGASLALRGSRLRGFVTGHPQLTDGVGALLLLLLFVPDRLREHPHPHPLEWVLHFGLLLPLVWRRRAPLTTFMIIAGLAFVQWAGDFSPPSGDVALLVALYSVAAHSTVRRLLIAAGVLEFGIMLAAARWSPDHHELNVFVLLSGMTTAAAVLGLNLRTRRAYLASLEDRAARLERERDQQAQIIAGEERARIARDVHDIVTHSLSVMVALTDGATYALPTSPERAADAIGKASAIGRQAIGEMQRILEVLRSGASQDGEPERGPQPGLRQLDTLLSEVRAAGLPVELVMVGEPPGMAPGAELALYRVIQEALTNTRKHAGLGATARVWLRYDADQVEIEVTDDGHREPTAESHGHGLTGMRERVGVYGGALHAGPLPTGGWQVRARFEPAQLEGAK
jgi:signal transduction histidine kinase